MVKHTKHTKGPWAPAIYTVTDTMIERLKSGPQAAICLNHSPNQKDEMLVAICGDASDPQSIADSHLIAAAPGMLEALQILMIEWRQDRRGPSPGIELAIRAIIKATGDK